MLLGCLLADVRAQVRQSIPAGSGFESTSTSGATIVPAQTTPLSPVQPLTMPAPPTTTVFDPYAQPNTSAASMPPTLYGQPAAGQAPIVVAPSGVTGQSYGTSTLGTPVPAGAYPPPAPNSLLPTITWPQGGFGSSTLNGTTLGNPTRLFNGPRFQYTWLYGGSKDSDFGIHDFDTSIVATYPNFLFSNQPLFIVPSFTFHLWEGPKAPGSDMPARAYSAFVDLGWNSDPRYPFGIELGGRVGIFSDFNSVTTRSVRTLGKALFTSRITPEVQLKGGVIYTDRLGIKLLPAGGILWTPNPDTRFDIFFPRPQLAQRFTTYGNNDVWWYLGGEWGGGSWTIERVPGGASDQVDINDIRVYLGLELGPNAMILSGNRLAFIEGGYVFNRNLEYRTGAGNLDLSDTFMFRVGLGY